MQQNGGRQVSAGKKLVRRCLGLNRRLDRADPTAHSSSEDDCEKGKAVARVSGFSHFSGARPDAVHKALRDNVRLHLAQRVQGIVQSGFLIHLARFSHSTVIPYASARHSTHTP